MRKIIALLLAVSLMFTFVGCSREEIDIRGTYESDNEKVESKEKSNVESDSTEEPEEKEFSMGNVRGNVYKSEFIGISYTLDSGWSFYDDEQIRELNQATMDMAGEEFEELMKNATVVQDMLATDGGTNSVNINLEKANSGQLAAYDEEKVFNATSPIIESSLSNMGYKNIEHRIDEIEVDGRMVKALFVEAEYGNMKIYEILFQKKCNGYIASMTVCAFDEDTSYDLIDNFEWID